MFLMIINQNSKLIKLNKEFKVQMKDNMIIRKKRLLNLKDIHLKV